jgi:hypothetical protein
MIATTPWGKCRFHRTNAPDQKALTELAHTISHRVAGFVEREGILERDEENRYLNREDGDEDFIQQVLSCLLSYRIAIGPPQGRKVITLQIIPAWENDDRFAQMAKVAGFSLRAGVAAQAWERQKLERLCRCDIDVIWGGIDVDTHLLFKDGSAYKDCTIPPDELNVHT